MILGIDALGLVDRAVLENSKFAPSAQLVTVAEHITQRTQRFLGEIVEGRRDGILMLVERITAAAHHASNQMVVLN